MIRYRRIRFCPIWEHCVGRYSVPTPRALHQCMHMCGEEPKLTCEPIGLCFSWITNQHSISDHPPGCLTRLRLPAVPRSSQVSLCIALSLPRLICRVRARGPCGYAATTRRGMLGRLLVSNRMVIRLQLATTQPQTGDGEQGSRRILNETENGAGLSMRWNLKWLGRTQRGTMRCQASVDMRWTATLSLPSRYKTVFAQQSFS